MTLFLEGFYSLDHLREGIGYEGEHENKGDDENDKSGEDLFHILRNES